MDGPVLAAVPRVANRMRAAKAFTAEPDSAVAESFRYLRARLEPMVIDPGHGPGKIVLVAGGERGDGRTGVASNLAAALAKAGSRVLLVDADVRRPSLGLIFGADVRPGLTDVLAGDAEAAEVTSQTHLPTLRLVTAGKVLGHPDLFSQASVARAAEQLRAAADVVVLDSSPVLVVSDSLALARHADVVLQTANVRSSHRQAIRAASQELRAAGAAALLGVLVGVGDREQATAVTPTQGRTPTEGLEPVAAPERLADVTAGGGQ
jgi:polysaccharide biosynthesis transport protein